MMFPHVKIIGEMPRECLIQMILFQKQMAIAEEMGDRMKCYEAAFARSIYLSALVDAKVIVGAYWDLGEGRLIPLATGEISG